MVTRKCLIALASTWGEVPAGGSTAPEPANSSVFYVKLAPVALLHLMRMCEVCTKPARDCAKGGDLHRDPPRIGCIDN